MGEAKIRFFAINLYSHKNGAILSVCLPAIVMLLGKNIKDLVSELIDLVANENTKTRRKTTEWAENSAEREMTQHGNGYQQKKNTHPMPTKSSISWLVTNAT